MTWKMNKQKILLVFEMDSTVIYTFFFLETDSNGDLS